MKTKTNQLRGEKERKGKKERLESKVNRGR